jgi:mevalonate kinase
MVTASAPGKIILLGEHAVVYGQPALAAPVSQLRATATVTSPPSPPLLNAEVPRSGEGNIWIEACDLNHLYSLKDAPPDDPLALAIRLTFTHYGLLITPFPPPWAPPPLHPPHELGECGSAADRVPFAPLTPCPRPLGAGVSRTAKRPGVPRADYSLRLTLSSAIPLASGLGSGAAICTAIVRALAAYLNSPISNSQISAIVFETEKLLHGTPSGIDNTVIAYEQPVYFIKGQPPEPFTVRQPFRLLIADTGLRSPTKITVGDVRAAWQKEPARYDALFLAAGEIANAARAHIENGEPESLGLLMNRNHALLREMGVSCAELDVLVEAALNAGALGAKLSGGGRGGNMLALVTAQTQDRVQAALERAGAKRVIATLIS